MARLNTKYKLVLQRHLIYSGIMAICFKSLTTGMRSYMCGIAATMALLIIWKGMTAITGGFKCHNIVKVQSSFYWVDA